MIDAHDALPASSIQPVIELFTGDVIALWATTYNVDLALFNEFLLPRLGEPPLNVVVLADRHRLAASLARIPPERADTLAAVNRRWLLRGLRPGGQTFHPKTYLAVSRNSVTLLVGSGNLSTDGLDEGREVFTRFHSASAVGAVAIETWRRWMRRLVAMANDIVLAERFRDLEDRLPAQGAVAPVLETPLLHNLDLPIAAQLASAVKEGAADTVEEMLLAAPYYDDDGAAVGRLLHDLAPRRVRIYVTSSTSVNGDRLVERLAGSGADVQIVAFEPDEFVHAKLVGVVVGAQGWLLSGSANISRAGLTCAPGEHGNVELAVLAAMEPEGVHAAFTPPDMEVVPRNLDSLLTLRFEADPEPDLPTVRLISATNIGEDRVSVLVEPSAQDGWFLDDLVIRRPLVLEANGRVVTDGPIAGRLVQVVDAAGALLSNRVVVDDPLALAAALTSALGHPVSDLPPELTTGDLDTPLAQALVWLHRNLVMDVSERASSAPTGGVGGDEEEDQADDAFWERLEREQLAHDPRASTYSRTWRQDGLGGNESILELLEVLAARTPSQPTPAAPGRSLLGHLLDDLGKQKKIEGPIRRWKTASRVRVRARNILRRWAAAQTDPRLVWVDPLAPGGNFAMIAGTLASLRLKLSVDPSIELTDEDIDDLWMRWLRPFVGTGQGDGWLDHLDPAGVAIARTRLPGWLPEMAAAMCWLLVRPGLHERERIIGLQPVLAAALHHHLVEPTDETARYLSVIAGRLITLAEVDDRLLKVDQYIDDDLWCARMASELGIHKLVLQASPGSASVQVRLDVSDIDDPLIDPCVPRLVVAARQYPTVTALPCSPLTAAGGWHLKPGKRSRTCRLWVEGQWSR